MSLFSRFFSRRPPDGLLEFVERVYVFDSCFSTEVLSGGMYKIYLSEIVTELYEVYPDSSFLALNFREGEKRSQFAETIAEYDVTVIDYPRQYEGCPLLPLFLVHHFLRVCESWLSRGHNQNVVLLHCESGSWALLAFLLASILIFRNLHHGEQRTLQLVHREAPKGLLQLLSPLNPLPSQLRYLQYVARRNISPEWPPAERALSLDCLILRTIPNFDSDKGCRPLVRIFGQHHNQNCHAKNMLFSMSKKKKSLRHYRQEDCDVIKIDIQCLVQGDVVLECVHLDFDSEREVMMFRVMFSTAFIRSNILILNCEDIDILWDAKGRYPKRFRAEVLFGEVDTLSSPMTPTPTLNGEAIGGLPIEAFSMVQELFDGIEWADSSEDAAFWLLKQISSNVLHERIENLLLTDVRGLSRLHGKATDRMSFASPSDSDEEKEDSVTSDSVASGEQEKIQHGTLISTQYENLFDERTCQGLDVTGSMQSTCASSISVAPSSPSPLVPKLSPTPPPPPPPPASSQKLTPSSPPQPCTTSMSPVNVAFERASQPPPSPMSSKDPPPPPPPPPPTMSAKSLPPHPPPPPPPPPPPMSTKGPSPPLPPPPPLMYTKGPPPPPPPPQPMSSKDSPPRPLPPPPMSSKGPPPPPPPPPSLSIKCPPPPPTPPMSSKVSQQPPPPPPLPSKGPLAPPSPPSSPRSLPPLVSVRGPSAPLPPPPTSFNKGMPPPPTSFNKGILPPSNSCHAYPKATHGAPPQPPPPPSSTVQNSPPAPPPLSGLNAPAPPPAPQAPRAPSNVPLPPPLCRGNQGIPGLSPVSGSRNSSAPAPPPSAGREKATAPGSGRVRVSTTNAQKKASLKPLHWVKVTRAMQGSLWADSQKQENESKAPEIDISELESLFSIVVDDGRAMDKSGARRGSNTNKPEIVHLVDMRRANNCEIMLTKIKMPLPEMINAVLALDTAALDIDQVENLIKFCPMKEEMEMLKNYTGNKEVLGKCEQFFLELMKVPRVESKLRVFSFRIAFSTQVNELRSNLNTINDASREVKSSVKLRQVMQTILTLGNALNQGTARGSAVGFRLDSLLKLSDTRARNNKMTLMHYLCKLIAEKMPELLDFDKDLIHLEAAAKIQLKAVAEEMQAVSKGLEKVELELSASDNDGKISIGFRKALKSFLDTAEADVRSLISLYSEVGRSADSLAQYFGEDPARCPFEQVTSILVLFVNMFKKSHEENMRNAEAEKKKQEKAAMK